MARHVNPKDNQKSAIAPYNFVPLPNAPLIVENGFDMNDAGCVKPWQQHNRIVSGLYSGHIDLTVETLTPMYIRGPVRKDPQGNWDSRETRLREEPFMTPEGRPVIPGSSLRGMVRTLFEMFTFSKIDPVSSEKPFYRSLGNDRLGNLYRWRMVRNNMKPDGGILRKHGSNWHIECRDVYRVSHGLLKHENVRIPQNADEHIDGKYQYSSCKIKVDDSKKVVAISLKSDQPLGAPWLDALLVLTGFAVEKKAEFALVDPGTAPREIRVPETMMERFHDEDQITQWQQNAFTGKHRKPKGGLADGDAVFYLLDEALVSDGNPDGLVFFGRAQMFRLPYDTTPAAMLPKTQHAPGLDMAQALFGHVGQRDGEKGNPVKGRVRVEDAVADKPAKDCLEAPCVPEILGSPKVTTFQHYLTQDGTKDAKDRTTYFEKDKTTPRGHKLYWHREAEWKSKTVKVPEVRNNPEKNTQHTIIQPVRKGTRFSGRIWFDNLAAVELGALLSTLALPGGCAHKIGMGKPLGLGSVKIAPTLHLIDPEERYASWSADGRRQVAAKDFMEMFERFIMQHVDETRETVLEGKVGLNKIARLDALFLMLSWDRKPPAKETRYMAIERGDIQRFEHKNEYKKRHVLPTPHGVMGEVEPSWPPDPPVAAPVPKETRKKIADNKRADSIPQPPKTDKYAVPAQKEGPKPLQEQQTDREGILEIVNGVWTARFEGEERAAVILNADKIPENTPSGTKAKFYIRTKNKHAFKVRFDGLGS